MQCVAVRLFCQFYVFLAARDFRAAKFCMSVFGSETFWFQWPRFDCFGDQAICSIRVFYIRGHADQSGIDEQIPILGCIIPGKDFNVAQCCFELGLAQRVLAIKSKRHIKRPIDFLTRTEAEALLAAPNQQTWLGRRDHMLILLALQTGLRLSEIIGLRCQDVALDSGPHVRCTGKGRKSRCVPLRKDTVTMLRAWLCERNAQPDTPLFPNMRGKPLSRDGVQYVLAKHLALARPQCPSLENKRVTPHVLRHSTAMELLQSGVDRSVISLWLGHERMDTTQIYLHASLELKEKALAKTEPFYGRPPRYRPPDQLMAFLQSL